MKMEEYGWVLDFLPQGRPTDKFKEPVAQLLGEDLFTILEVTVKPNVSVRTEQRVFVGKGDRNEIERIKKRINYDELTSTAKSELHSIIMKVVMQREAFFVNFLNICGPVNIRQHQLELLPGIGKRHMEEILEEREKKPFESFEDIKQRIPLLPNPAQLLANRIEEEIKGLSKYYLFVKPPVYETPETQQKRW